MDRPPIRSCGSPAAKTARTLVDTNVLLDLATNDPVWADWSVRALAEAARRGSLVINDVVYAELSVRFKRPEDIDAMLDGAGIISTPIPRHALFLAGKAFQRTAKAAAGEPASCPISS